MSEKEITKEELQKKVAELEAEISILEKDLIHDHLTNLKTRAFFEEEVQDFLDLISNKNDSKRREWFGFKNLSILFFDIDHFKKINDTYGHQVGDSVLLEVSTAIVSCLREGDTVARWGGEEIVASLLGANKEDAKLKAEEIRLAISLLQFNGHPNLSVSVSIGVATATKDEKLEDLVRRADTALYQAKKEGRNMVVHITDAHSFNEGN